MTDFRQNVGRLVTKSEQFKIKPSCLSSMAYYCLLPDHMSRYTSVIRKTSLISSFNFLVGHELETPDIPRIK